MLEAEYMAVHSLRWILDSIIFGSDALSAEEITFTLQLLNSLSRLD